jgi:DNA-binding LacI/PurR family transcriptional regulator
VGLKRAGRPGIRDVAREAGVSITTVSDALNGKGRLDATTRARVVEAAVRLGYRGNASARSLRRGRSGTLAFMTSVPAFETLELAEVEYFVKLMSGAATTALSHGFALVLAPLEAEKSPFEALPIDVDGTLLMDPVAGTPLLPMLEESGIPTVTIGRWIDRAPGETWWTDNDIAGSVRQMLDLLAARGARKIAIIANDPIRSYVHDTVRTYEEWCGSAGIEPRVVQVGPLANVSTAYGAMARWLEGESPPDAIYATVDRLAVGALMALAAAGIRVPDDVLIAAGSDSGAARSAQPPVTVLELHPTRLGQIAIEMLLKRIEHPDAPPEQTIVQAVILERGSTVRQPADSAGYAVLDAVHENRQ